ncbi:MAG: cupin domain-containing protein [Polyangiaceae bacterium]
MWNVLAKAAESGEISCDVRKALFGGSGEVRVWMLLGPVVPPFDCALACELSVGGSVGKHIQETCAEVLVFVEGEGEVTVADMTGMMRPSATVVVPQGETLSIRNTGNIPLRYLIIKARA